MECANSKSSTTTKSININLKERIMTLFKKLKELSFRFIDKNDYFDFYFLGEIKNWPNGNDGTPQDKENVSCIRLEEDYMIIHCGGHWQTPVESLV